MLPQLASGDEVIVIRLDCPWGGQARNRAMRMASADYLCFLDADDVLTAGALQEIRFQTGLHPGRMHCFSMRTPGGQIITVPEDRQAIMGEIGSPMIVVPNDHRLGKWSDRYEQDWDFYYTTLGKHRSPAVRHETVVCQLRPHEVVRTRP